MSLLMRICVCAHDADVAPHPGPSLRGMQEREAAPAPDLQGLKEETGIATLRRCAKELEKVPARNLKSSFQVPARNSKGSQRGARRAGGKGGWGYSASGANIDGPVEFKHICLFELAMH